MVRMHDMPCMKKSFLAKNDPSAYVSCHCFCTHRHKSYKIFIFSFIFSLLQQQQEFKQAAALVCSPSLSTLAPAPLLF